jgi:hypothetical protein
MNFEMDFCDGVIGGGGMVQSSPFAGNGNFVTLFLDVVQ